MLLRHLSALLLASALAVGTSFAQDSPKSEPDKFYKLEFVLKELDNARVVNSRSYFISVAVPSRDKSEIRTTMRVPFQTSGDHVEWQEVGTNLDCFNVREVPEGLSLTVVAGVNSVLQEPSAGTMEHPIIRHNEWHSAVVIPLKKPTVIFSSDDPASKRQMQLELSATPIR